jgi:transcriptional repressor NrdR
MLCPKCKKNETNVIDSRDSGDYVIRRRRECPKCKNRFTTYEKIESPQVMVIKKNGNKQPFSREKIVTGVYRACTGRPVPEIKIENLADEIEEKVNERESDEINSKEIGGMVIEKLKKIDEVAYLRFASVYKSFGSAKTFAKEIQNLNK